MTRDIPADLPKALDDAQQLAIAFGNLIHNGCASMPCGGRLTSSAQHVQDDIDVAVTEFVAERG